MERILVTGGSGLLGSKISAYARECYEVISTYFANPVFSGLVKLDITDKEDVFRVISKYKPDVVFHTAAETDVDKCELDKERAWKTNVEGTKNIAEVCGKLGLMLVYISTDYVFDGEKGQYSEDDTPNPINYYGLTKLKGEEIVAECCKNFLIARASVIYGWHPSRSNFVTWVIDSLKQGKKISVVNDHFNSPTFADGLAKALLESVEKGASGLYHMAGRERISRYDFAIKIADVFDLDKSLILPIKMEDLKAWIAKRPRDSSLRTEKIRGKLGIRLENVEEGLEKMKEASE